MALVFESATILTNIFIGQRGQKTGELPICRMQKDFDNPSQLSDYVSANTITIDNPDEEAWVAYTPSEYALIQKIEKQGNGTVENPVHTNGSKHKTQ